ncbi:MAG: type II toxin-antitoxin system VapC family toxin [Verrucomicrobiota bacterium]|nr:type II toxin-antitoxin system VapC family toxin [Verrucomicrobiota bacterium]
MVVYPDTSFLFSLYGDDANSPRAINWIQRQGMPLTLSAFNEYQLANALRFAEYRKAIPKGAAAQYLAGFESDKASGRIVVKVCNLAAVIDVAKRLSTTHTLTSGHRGFDILHVACAIVVGATIFLTFDSNQQKLAKAEAIALPDL